VDLVGDALSPPPIQPHAAKGDAVTEHRVLHAFLVGCVLVAVSLLPGTGRAQDPPAKDEAQDATATAEPTDDPFDPRYQIEAIEVRGNNVTRTDLVLSYLELQAGDLLDQRLVELSRFRLLALGYFKDVRMRLERGSGRGLVRLVVEVEERWTIIIDDIFLGTSDANTFWGGLGVSDINFLGLGMVLSGAFVASEHQYAGRLGAYWPSVLGSRYAAGLMAYGASARELALVDYIEESSELGCEFTENDSLPYWRAGAIVYFGFNLARSSRLSFQLQGEHIQAEVDERISDAGEKCKTEPFLDYLRPGGSTLVSLSAQFEHDTRDDYFLPTRGLHLIFSVELASKIMGSDYEYSKYMAQYEHSVNPYLDHVWRFTIVGGLLQDVGERGSPFFERFFIGDYARFQIDKRSLPRNLDLNFSSVTDYGDLLISAEFEYDIPLWSQGVFFYRGYAYAALNFSFLTKASFLALEEEWIGRTKRPVTFDLGLKFETPIGLLTFSAGYVADLFVD